MTRRRAAVERRRFWVFLCDRSGRSGVSLGPRDLDDPIDIPVRRRIVGSGSERTEPRMRAAGVVSGGEGKDETYALGLRNARIQKR
jgi:hypothetical protein